MTFVAGWRNAATLVALPLATLAIAYFGIKIAQLADTAGYDFRYIWLAGELWRDGLDPYDSVTYSEAAGGAFETGHSPEKWVYPPTWWCPAVVLSTLSPEVANVAWNGTTVALIAVSCWLLSGAWRRSFARKAWHSEGRFAHPRLLLFSGLFFLMAVFEATAIHLSTGQTTVVTLFGATLLLLGLQSGRKLLGVLGVVLLLMKPQIGLCFLVPLVLRPAIGWWVVTVAFAVTFALSIPAILVDPSVFVEFGANVAAYDGFTEANLPQSMTGIRHLIWETTDFDVGNKLAVLITLAAVLAVFVGPFRIDHSPDSAIRAWQIVATVTALTLMFAPLHTYDFVLIALVALVPLSSRPTIIGIALVGIAVTLRAENMADLTGFHREGVDIFPGSRFLSLGALVFGAAVIGSMTYWNRSGASETDETNK